MAARSRSSSRSYSAAMLTDPRPTLKPWLRRRGVTSMPRPSISHRWLNWCSGPDAGRDDCIICIASPDITRPSASWEMAPTSPTASRSGRASEGRSRAWTSSQTSGSIGSMPSASAIIQSAEAGTLPIRSPNPDAVITRGAAAMIAVSETLPRGAGHSWVILKPWLVMDAPKAV